MEYKLKIFLAASLLGILALLFLSQALAPQIITPISNITNESLNEQVVVFGTLTSIRDYSNNTFHVITLQDLTGSIEAIMSTKASVAFKETLNKSLNYTISGKVSEYNSTLQINADIIQPVQGLK